MRRLIFITLLASLWSPVATAELAAFKAGPAALDGYAAEGKWLVVMLWASDCVACNREARQYIDFHEFHHDVDASVLGISLDGNDQLAAQKFIDRHEVSFPNLISDYESAGSWFEGLTGQQFRGTPGFLIIDPKGELRAQQIGAVPVELIEQFIKANSPAGETVVN